MAWSWVAIGNVTTVSSGNLSPTLPSGTQNGDLLVACISYRDNAAFTVPSGWSLIAQHATGDTVTAPNSGKGAGLMAYIIRGASTPSNTFTRTGGDAAMGRILSYRSDTTFSFKTHNSIYAEFSPNSSFSLGSISPTGNNPLLVGMTAHGDNVNFTGLFDAVTDPSVASAQHSSVAVGISTSDPTSNTWLNRSFNSTTVGADTNLTTADGLMTAAGSTGTLSASAGNGGLGHVFIVAAFSEAGATTHEVSSTIALSAAHTSTSLASYLSSLSLSTSLSEIVNVYKSLFTISTVDSMTDVSTVAGTSFFSQFSTGVTANVLLTQDAQAGTSLSTDVIQDILSQRLVDVNTVSQIQKQVDISAESLATSLSYLSVDSLKALETSAYGSFVKTVLLAKILSLAITSTGGPSVRATVGVFGGISALSNAQSLTSILVLNTLSDIVSGGKFFGESTQSVDITTVFDADNTINKVGRVTVTVDKAVLPSGLVTNAASRATLSVQANNPIVALASAATAIQESSIQGLGITADIVFDLAVAIPVQIQYNQAVAATARARLLLPVTEVVELTANTDQYAETLLGKTVTIINRFPLGSFPADDKRFVFIDPSLSLVVLNARGDVESYDSDYSFVMQDDEILVVINEKNNAILEVK